MKIICNMGYKAYRCRDCGTGYSTTGNEKPPTPNWSDGHECELVEVESLLNDNE